MFQSIVENFESSFPFSLIAVVTFPTARKERAFQMSRHISGCGKNERGPPKTHQDMSKKQRDEIHAVEIHIYKYAWNNYFMYQIIFQ